MSTSKKPSRLSHLDDSQDNAVRKTSTDEMGEILANRYTNLSAYKVFMLVLAVAIIWTSVLIAKQVQQHHEDYRALQDMKAQYQRLQIEHRRLIIEQQTFSATPQIASRAVSELGMYHPTTKDKWILQPSVTPKSLDADLEDDNKDVKAKSKITTSYITTQEVSP